MSDQDNNVFNEDTPAQDDKNTIQSDLVGEGKKYATVELALEALGHSQNHIEKLERENQEARDELAVRMSVEDQLKAHATSDNITVDDQATQRFSEEDLERFIENKLSEKDKIALAKANAQSVKSYLTEMFGSEAKDKFKEKSEQLGINLDELAAKSPAAVKELFKAETKQSTSPSSSVNSESMSKDTNSKDHIPESVMSGATRQQKIDFWRDCYPTES